jgi:hypothetical protein
MHNRETIAEITVNGENAVTIAGKVLKALTKI